MISRNFDFRINSKNYERNSKNNLRHQAKRKDGTFPVKVRIMNRGVAKYVPVRIDGVRLALTMEAWNELQKGGLRGKKLRLQTYLDEAETKVKTIIKKVTASGEKLVEPGNLAMVQTPTELIRFILGA